MSQFMFAASVAMANASSACSTLPRGATFAWELKMPSARSIPDRVRVGTGYLPASTVGSGPRRPAARGLDRWRLKRPPPSVVSQDSSQPPPACVPETGLTVSHPQVPVSVAQSETYYIRLFFGHFEKNSSRKQLK